MNTNEPIELEQLLRDKGFNELTDAEKRYVLSMIGSESEYQTMRRIVQSASHDDAAPPASLYDDVMRAYDQHHSRRNIIPIWYSNRPLYRQPLLRVAAAITALIALWWIFPSGNEPSGQFAERRLQPIENQSEDTPDSTIQSASVDSTPSEQSDEPNENNNLIAEVKPEKVAAPDLFNLSELAEEEADIASREDESHQPTSARVRHEAGMDRAAAPAASGKDMDYNAQAMQEVVSANSVQKSDKEKNQHSLSLRLKDRPEWVMQHYEAW